MGIKDSEFKEFNKTVKAIMDKQESKENRVAVARGRWEKACFDRDDLKKTYEKSKSGLDPEKALELKKAIRDAEEVASMYEDIYKSTEKESTYTGEESAAFGRALLHSFTELSARYELEILSTLASLDKMICQYNGFRKDCSYFAGIVTGGRMSYNFMYNPFIIRLLQTMRELAQKHPESGYMDLECLKQS